MKTIKIVSRHNNVADAVKAAGFSRPGYETALADAIRLSDSPPARWQSGPHAVKPCKLAFVVEAFSNAARIYGDKLEVVYVTECDIAILNRLEIGGCLSDSGMQVARVTETHIEIGVEVSIGSTVLLPEGKAISKTSAGRAWLARLHQTFPTYYASGLSYCG